MIIYLTGLYTSCIALITGPFFLLVVILLSFCVKSYFLTILVPKGLRSSAIRNSWLFLIGTLAGSLFGDIAWVIKLARQIEPGEIYSYGIVLFFIRIGWGFLVVQYQSLSCFIQSITEKHFRLNFIHRLFIGASTAFALYFFVLAFSEFSCDIPHRELSEELLEFQIMRYVAFYLLNLLILPSLYLTFKRIRSQNLPKILRNQLKTFLLYLICPYLFAEFLLASSLIFQPRPEYLYPTVSLSTILLTCAIYYCLRKVMGLRFLNFANHVQAPYKINVIDNFKTVLEQLSHATNLHELKHITQAFFKDAFRISLRATSLYIRENNASSQEQHAVSKIESLVEHFLVDPETRHLIKQNKIFIYDEIVFTHFYEESKRSQLILRFLRAIDADIFIPIFTRNSITGYIVVIHGARQDTCYHDIERDEMVVFASYLGSIINLMQNSDMELLIQKERELVDDLYSKHQEIDRFKETIRSFLRTNQQKMSGIIIYKNRTFNFANQVAEKMVNMNLNTQVGHPLAKAFREVAQYVETYKTPYRTFTRNLAGNTVVIAGMPHLDAHHVILTISSPDIAEVINRHMDLLHNPAHWDYLLYLESTNAGQLINTLLPGYGEQLLRIKIDLFKATLTKRATYIEAPREDITPIVELIHHISPRDTLHVLTIDKPTKSTDIAALLFGNGSAANTSNEPCLFEKLSESGTLYIRNIHFLDLELQNHLADFIRTGNYRSYHGDQRIPSNVRLICSGNNTLHHLVQEGAFSPQLYNELKRVHISIPSVITLPDHELYALIDGYTQQALKTDAYKTLLELSERDKAHIAHRRPASFTELRTKVHQYLIHKSKKHDVYDDNTFDPAYEVSDPELVRAARLGRYALKDPKIMQLLWQKFKSQNKIAIFLGVNRSSVNRRCKEYNLIS